MTGGASRPPLLVVLVGLCVWGAGRLPLPLRDVEHNVLEPVVWRVLVLGRLVLVF